MEIMLGRKNLVSDINWRQAIKSKSFRNLLASNLVTLLLALWQKWDFNQLMWIYWGQSVVIGVFQFLKILNLKKFSTENFTINGRSVSPSVAIKITTAIFFVLHYGFFHLLYLIFLATFALNRNLKLEILGILFTWVIFFLNHLQSYRSNCEQDIRDVPNIGRMMFSPYARIIPMHLTIVIGFRFLANADDRQASNKVLLFFLLLKIAIDLFTHCREHFVKSEARVDV